jgi:hypothetical protein
MNNFLSYILIQNTVAEYEIYKKGDQYKALLIINHSSAHLPLELSFWKEGGRWRTSQMLNEHVLYQFASNIDNHLLSDNIAQWKTVAA